MIKDERIAELEQRIAKLDCRYAGEWADISGSHCPVGESCARCLYEARIAELEAKLVDTESELMELRDRIGDFD